MKAVTVVRGRAIPLDRRDVDTDQIIPARHLKRIERTGFGEFAFEAWRRDPGFVLNNPLYHRAPIMITRDNFGSGSSREHAVWALEGLGIRALVGTTFADIFKSNSFQGGLLTIELAAEDIDHLMRLTRDHPETELVVDLESQEVALADGSWSRTFEIDPYRKYRLLRGLDDITMTLEYTADIEAYEAQRHPLLPSTTRRVAGNVRWKA